ncbi:hypothetical protein APHAL10511_004155 [Amanita phalloides]|nr:hypothetical protein APHAL10511_004155 [Amanita phalloides]
MVTVEIGASPVSIEVEVAEVAGGSGGAGGVVLLKRDANGLGRRYGMEVPLAGVAGVGLGGSGGGFRGLGAVAGTDNWVFRGEGRTYVGGGKRQRGHGMLKMSEKRGRARWGT